MVAPVVLMTTAAILIGGILSVYGSVNDRMRQMDAERLKLLSGPDGTAILPVSELTGPSLERVEQIDVQLPMLLRRHDLLHYAALLAYASVTLVVVGVVVIGIGVTTGSEAVSLAALGLVLAGAVTLLAGVLVAAWSIRHSRDAINFEVRRSLSLGS